MIRKDLVAGMNVHSLSRDELMAELKSDIQSNQKKGQYISITNT